MDITLIPTLTFNSVPHTIDPITLSDGIHLKPGLIAIVNSLCNTLKLTIKGLDWTNDAEHLIEAEVQLTIDETVFNETFEKRGKEFIIKGTMTDITELCALFIEKVEAYSWPV